MIHEIFVRILADVILKIALGLIERTAPPDFSANVIHAIHERYKRSGNGPAVKSALTSALRCVLVNPALGFLLAYAALVNLGFEPINAVTPVLTKVLAPVTVRYPLIAGTIVSALVFVQITSAFFLASLFVRIIQQIENRGITISRYLGIVALPFLLLKFYQVLTQMWAAVVTLLTPAPAEASSGAALTASVYISLGMLILFMLCCIVSGVCVGIGRASEYGRRVADEVFARVMRS